MHQASEDAFANEQSPDGTPWPDLAESTKASREKAGKWPGQMLQLSQGGLASRITTDYGSEYAGIGTNKVYGPTLFFDNEGVVINVPCHQRQQTHVFGKKLEQPITVSVEAYSYTGLHLCVSTWGWVQTMRRKLSSF